MELLVSLFGGMCILLAIIVVSLDNQRAKLSFEKGTADGKVLKMENEIAYLWAASLPDTVLTTDDVMRAIRGAGYVPESVEGWIKFQVQGINYFVETKNPPLVVVARTFNCRESEWDLYTLREAGRLVTEEKNMPKIVFDEADAESQLFRGHIFIAVMDRNVSSFKTNLKLYVKLLDDGMCRMTELYNKLERKDASMLAVKSFLAQKEENQVTS